MVCEIVNELFIMSPSPSSVAEFKKKGLSECFLETEKYYIQVDPYVELDNLQRNAKLVHECMWYHSSCNSAEAKEILSQTAIGTFLLRCSSDPKYLYSLSVRTEHGPTSVRIKYSRGLFQLDCEERVRKILPRFENVVALIDFHLTLAKSDQQKHCRWLENSGRKKLSVKLDKPFLKKPGSLKHLCRLSVNTHLTDIHIPQISTDRLPIPHCLKDYLREYSYKV